MEPDCRLSEGVTGASFTGLECLYAAGLENLHCFLDTYIYLSGNGWPFSHIECFHTAILGRFWERYRRHTRKGDKPQSVAHWLSRSQNPAYP